MRALIAARKSNKVDRGEGMSLDTQDEYARKFCDRLGLDVVGVARDTISGRTAPIDRRDLGAWLKEPWKFDVIVAWKTHRLSRGTQEDWTRIEHWATENGKTLIMADSSTGVRYPARDDSDYWQWQAFKRNAGQEWESIRERNVRAQDALQAKGAYMGRAPFGYRRTGPKYGKTLEIFEPEAAIVREVFRMVREGVSLRIAGDYLKGQTGKPWHPVLVKRMIENWTYAGRVERKGEAYAKVPAIVTTDELVEAQAAMKARNTKAQGGRPSETPALMVLTCGACEERIKAEGLEGFAKPGRLYRTRGKYYHLAGVECRFNVPCEAADNAVKKILFASTEPEMTETLIRGKKASGERERIKRDREAALRREDIEEVLRLTEALRVLPQEDEPDRVEYRPTGRTVGEVYAEMSEAELRDVLKAWTVTAYPDGKLTLASPWREA